MIVKFPLHTSFKWLLILFLIFLPVNSFAQPISHGSLEIAEEDGDPSTFPATLKVTNGTLTDNGDGTASLSISGDATAWDDIGNPDAADEIDFGAYVVELNVENFQIGDGGANYVDFDGTPTITFAGNADIDLPNDSVDDADIDWANMDVLQTLVGLDAIGAVDLDYGSANVLDHTFTSDGGTIILDGSITPSNNIYISDDQILRIGATEYWDFAWYKNREDFLGINTAKVGTQSDIDVGMVTIAVDTGNSGCTVNQEIFEVGRGATDDADADFVELFAVDEDGDVSANGNITSLGTIEGATLTEGGTAVYNTTESDAAYEAELDNSAGLMAALSDETGTGAGALAVFNISPQFETSILGNYLTASEILGTDASKNIVSLPVATYPSLTELSYVKGLSSAIQTQLGNKAPTTSPTFATSITGSYLTASELLGTGASSEIVSLPVATYPSLAELAYVKGVTSAIQTQISNILNGTTAFTDINATDIIDSDNYNAGSIDYEHLADDVVSGAAAVGTFASGDTFLCLEAGVGLRECDYDDLPAGGASEINVILHPQEAKFPTSAFAALDAGASGWKLLYDQTTQEFAVWEFVLDDDYGAGTLYADVYFSMASGEANEVQFEGYVMAYTPATDTADWDTDSYDTVNEGSATTVAATAGRVYKQTITLTNADSAAAGDIIRFKLSTDSDDATNDDATGDREVRMVVIRE